MLLLSLFGMEVREEELQVKGGRGVGVGVRYGVREGENVQRGGEVV